MDKNTYSIYILVHLEQLVKGLLLLILTDLKAGALPVGEVKNRLILIPYYVLKNRSTGIQQRLISMWGVVN
ncbi:MAG: hypothetical protein K8R68_03840 [Bacteroidales bacterium]|nr:hypothetical protein [Bacteroidales bacterium]